MGWVSTPRYQGTLSRDGCCISSQLTFEFNPHIETATLPFPLPIFILFPKTQNPYTMQHRRERLKVLMKQGRAEHIADLHNDGKCGLHRTIAQAHLGFAQVIRKERVTRASRESRWGDSDIGGTGMSRLLGQDNACRRGRGRGRYNTRREDGDAAAATQRADSGQLQPRPPQSPHVVPHRRESDKVAAEIRVANCLSDYPHTALSPLPVPKAAPMQQSFMSSSIPFATLTSQQEQAAPTRPEAIAAEGEGGKESGGAGEEGEKPKSRYMSFYLPPKDRRPRVHGTEVLHSLPGLGYGFR